MTTLTAALFVTVDGHVRGKNAPANYSGAAPLRNDDQTTEKGTTP
jgi:hypothetical protein